MTSSAKMNFTRKRFSRNQVVIHATSCSSSEFSIASFNHVARIFLSTSFSNPNGRTFIRAKLNPASISNSNLLPLFSISITPELRSIMYYIAQSVDSTPSSSHLGSVSHMVGELLCLFSRLHFSLFELRCGPYSVLASSCGLCLSSLQNFFSAPILSLVFDIILCIVQIFLYGIFVRHNYT